MIGVVTWAAAHKIWSALIVLVVVSVLASPFTEEGPNDTAVDDDAGPKDRSSDAVESESGPEAEPPGDTSARSEKRPGISQAGPKHSEGEPPEAQPSESATRDPEPERTPPGVPTGAQAATVTSITDGDTLHLSVPRQGALLGSSPDVTVRLLEIDTPETVDPGEPVQCYGPQATTALTRLAPPGSTVYVLDDQELTDSYDRTLLYLWSVSDGRGRFVNKALVRGGYAIASLYAPNDRYIDAMRRAEAGARAADRGLWGACPRFGAPLNQPEPEPDPEPAPDATGGDGSCDPFYSGACIPTYPPDLDCTEIDAQGFKVVGDDPHGFDADGDGVACDP